MADWKAGLLPASFRGIPFFIETHTFSGGRHAVQHEPPNRNGGFAEDIGKKTPNFKISGHVLGDNYFFIRDALINAMETSGSGVLVHPYLGIKDVQPVTFSVTENTKEGRIAFFSLEFAEAGSASFPFAIIDAVTDFATTAVSTVLAVKAAFELSYSIAGLPAFALDSAEEFLVDLKETFDAAFRNVRVDSEKHAELSKKNDELGDNAATLVRGDPAVLVESIDEIIDGFRTLVPNAPENDTVDSTSGRDDKLAVFNDLIVFTGGSENIPDTTPTREKEKANGQALANAVQQLAIVRLSQQTVDKEFKSNTEAADQRTSITESIQTQLDKPELSDEEFSAMEDLNAKLVAAVPNTTALENISIKDLEILESVPAIVLAYDLYESADNERDIIDRNKVRNPTFVTGDIEVLTAS
jgi:hypothetical protein